jgi:hypothetical protein
VLSTRRSKGSTGVVGVSLGSGLGCSSSSWGGITAGGIAICGITIGCKDTYSGLAGSVGNLLPPSKIRSISENNSSINLSAEASADQGWIELELVNGLLALGLVLTS